MRSVIASTSSIRMMTKKTLLTRNIHATFIRQNDEKDDGFARPGPPPLPMKEQREFERLVRENASE